MKIVLSHGYFLCEDEKEKAIMRPYAPLGILYISSYLEQHGFCNEVFDTTFSSKTKLYKYLEESRPDVVGLYVNLMTKINILQIIRFIKDTLPTTRILLGGPDARYNAENYLRAGAAVVVMGEGEATTLEVIQAIEQKKDSYHHVAGVAFSQRGEIVFTSERAKMKDIDKLTPDRTKIDFNPYLNAWREAHGKSAMSISTMRGCPYTCKWCSRAVYGLSYRRRSPKQVIEEIKDIVLTYRPDTLWFVDDVFTISHKWLTDFAQALQTSGITVPYECITRADRMNEDVIRLLKDTGCFRVWIGAESGSQNVIDLMDRRVEVQQVREMIRLSKAHGIQAGTFIMLGYPGETEQDIFETIKHLKISDPDFFTITVAYPIKGTELYQETAMHHIHKAAWDESTDREIEFKRIYSRRYYEHAMRHVINEVHYAKAKRKNRAAWVKFKLKSVVARSGMWWHSVSERNSFTLW